MLEQSTVKDVGPNPSGSKRGGATTGYGPPFKTWSHGDTEIDPALAKPALGHAVRGDLQKAYDRAIILEKRRRVMAQRAEYLTGASKGQVVQLAEHRA